MKDYIFTSESVTLGHPDKICDFIADCILDEALKQDKYSKMAVEVTIKDEIVFIYGEASTNAKIDYEQIAKQCLREIGYHEDYHVILKISKQSKEIHQAVDKQEVCAGDQGIMFGYACRETESYMPAPIYYAHQLAFALSLAQKRHDFLGPDGKTQVSVEYKNGQVARIDTIVVSTQHTAMASLDQIKEVVMQEVIQSTIPDGLLDEDTKYYINPSGSFIVGGSFGDSGTTGRKIICDTYGGMGRIGGGCLSSKDPSKVDRTGAYYARYVAKNIVANGLADRCEIQVSYAIGQAKPISLMIDTFGTGLFSDQQIEEIVENNFDFCVQHMIDELDLYQPIYHLTSCYGHFGKEILTWEKVKKLNIPDHLMKKEG
ncbi:methionine adenosyltransferase [Allocoprobacillus halotolerans]|uniref:Methionine adenosyltransferase n=1 Tax=Allocoprobacillus halotolerans TaxID=2944914 RepID=A0ABY5I7Q4_9FIRM|nr:methionine adenosyltransferase [Allocoprobacillus halotolerans]UTY40063.1 methionine adenosyltransferase [Allocoprobacillus halotolerans]